MFTPATLLISVHRRGKGRVGVEFSFLLTLGSYVQVNYGFILAV